MMGYIIGGVVAVIIVAIIVYRNHRSYVEWQQSNPYYYDIGDSGYCQTHKRKCEYALSENSPIPCVGTFETCHHLRMKGE